MLNYPFGPVVFDAPGGMPTVVQLKLPGEGYINTIRLNQLEGTRVGGSFRIFQSKEAADAIAGSIASSAIVGTDPDDYSVVGVLPITAGSYYQNQTKYSYTNQDANQSSRKRQLWLVIVPDGTGDKTWSISMQIGVPVMVTAGA